MPTLLLGATDKMQTPDEDVLRSFVNLENNPNWERIFAWIKRSRDIANRALYENTVFRAGGAAELQDFIDKVESANDKLEQAKIQMK
jgi:hypothetical protein